MARWWPSAEPDDGPPRPPDRLRWAPRFAEVVVPPGTLWVMGDHRSRSADARCRGPVPVADVVGRAVAVVLPVDRRALLAVPPPWRELTE